MYKTSSKLAFLFCVNILSLTTAYAETFNVSTTSELRDALKIAATNNEDDTVYLADGIYKTSDDNQGKFIYQSNEENKLSIIGKSPENVIISGDNSHQILIHNSTKFAPLHLENLTFKDGFSDNYIIEADYKIDVADCHFIDNKTNWSILRSASTSLIFNSRFENNQLGSGAVNSESAKIIESTFIKNKSTSTTSSYGGAINVSKNVEVIDSVFDGNSASTGGAIYTYSSEVYNNGFVKIVGSTFRNNIATSTYRHRKGGGAIVARNLDVYNSVFESNISSRCGGAIYSSGNIRIENSIFANNSADEEVTIQNGTAFNGCSGGGVWVSSDVISLNSLYVGNSSAIQVAYGENSTLLNNAFWDNANYDIDSIPVIAGSSALVEGVIETLNNNYIDESRLTITFFSSNNIFENINLGFIDEEKGDYRLTINSGLIDIGTTDINGITIPIKDLNGSARVSGDSIDIGPYEFDITKDTDDDSVPDINDAFPLIPLGSLSDSDNDGRPDTCDEACVELGMAADTDDDNDGVLDVVDAYPLVSIGDLIDTDADGAPDNCNTACDELGMKADTDDDNDGALDLDDAFPLDVKDYLDSDNDGLGDNYELDNGLSISNPDFDADGLKDGAEIKQGTNPKLADSDDDGVIDGIDRFPLISIGSLLDSDNDGAPDVCDEACLSLGMTEDRDGIAPYTLLEQPTPQFAGLTPTAKIIVTGSEGENFFDVAKYISNATTDNPASVVGETFLISGSSDIDGFMVQPGVKYDLTNLKGGIDKLYFSGPLAEYADSILLDAATGVMQVSRLTDVGEEIVQFIATASAADTLIFTDGALSTADVKAAVSAQTPLTDLTLDTSIKALDDKTITGATVKHIVLNSDGGSVMGLGPSIKTLISGNSGIDQIYIPAGSIVDASNLKSGRDEITLEGNLADYDITLDASGNIVLNREVDIDDVIHTELVTLANGGNVATNDLVIFADQQLDTSSIKQQL
jgi:predicted outer membrane repeat protein